MTTTEQWSELVEWIGARFPDKPWAAEQAVAYFYDLEDYDASDVWSGLFALYDAGQRFAPNGSQLVAAARAERRRTAIDDLYRKSDRALPADAEDSKPVEWGDYSQRRFGEVLTPTQVVARIHAESTKCKNTDCDIHYPLGDDG